MLIEEKIKQIRQKVIEVNKDIVALKFGCEVEREDKGKGVIFKTGGTPPFYLDFFRYDAVFSGGSVLGFYKKCKKTKIIGQEIRLEDILLALESNRRLLRDRFVFDSKGYLEHLNWKTGKCFSQVVWEYGKPLTDQSEPTINFIYEIFYGK